VQHDNSTWFMLMPVFVHGTHQAGMIGRPISVLYLYCPQCNTTKVVVVVVVVVPASFDSLP
jgi:hypothetical protein